VDVDARTPCNEQASDQDFIYENNVKRFYCQKHLKKTLSMLGYDRTSSLYDTEE